MTVHKTETVSYAIKRLYANSNAKYAIYGNYCLMMLLVKFDIAAF